MVSSSTCVASLAAPAAFSEVQTIPVLSTGHLTRHDAELLDTIAQQDESPLVVMNHGDFGFWVYVSSHFSRSNPDVPCPVITDLGYSTSFCRIMITACLAGHQWVRFDCDGFQQRNFPVYEW